MIVFKIEVGVKLFHERDNSNAKCFRGKRNNNHSNDNNRLLLEERRYFQRPTVLPTEISCNTTMKIYTGSRNNTWEKIPARYIGL